LLNEMDAAQTLVRTRDVQARNSLEAGARISAAAPRSSGLNVALHPRAILMRAAMGGSRQGSWR